MSRWPSLGDRLFERIVQPETPLECWRWAAHINKVSGYAQTGSGYAHRAIYEVIFGPIPDGLQLDHLCQNRWCVNPYHLEPVTCRENLRRAGTVGKALCKRGHTLDYIRPDGKGRDCKTCRHIVDINKKFKRA